MTGETVVVVPPVDTSVAPIVIDAGITNDVANLADKVEDLVEAKKDENTSMVLIGIAALAEQISAGFTMLANVLEDVRSATVEIADDVGALPDVVEEIEDGENTEVITEVIPEVPLTAEEKEAVEEVTERSTQKKRYFI